MSAINPGVYRSILRIRPAWAFDIAGLLMRFYYCMINIGTVTMLTLSGYPFLVAGLVSSTCALALFLVSPRIAKLIDQRGQSRILPRVLLLPIVGTVSLLVCVVFQAPAGALFAPAILMGCVCSPQALVRARWTFLVRTRAFAKATPSLHSVLSYEAILDDIAFMLAPALSIFLASSITPIAGLTCGIVAFTVGTLLLVGSKSTEPVPGWKPADAAVEAALSDEAVPVDLEAPFEGAADATVGKARVKSIFRTSSPVRVLFFMMLFLGLFFGALDTTTVSFAESLHDPNLASVALMCQSFASVVMGFVFGMVRLPFRQSTQLVLTAVLFSALFACTAFITTPLTLFAITIPAALTYAPLLITINATCEEAVPGSRFTEAITWVNAGATCGMTVGPTLAGAVVDTWGTLAAFQVGAVTVTLTGLLALIFRRRFTSEARRTS